MEVANLSTIFVNNSEEQQE